MTTKRNKKRTQKAVKDHYPTHGKFRHCLLSRWEPSAGSSAPEHGDEPRLHFALLFCRRAISKTGHSGRWDVEHLRQDAQGASTLTAPFSARKPCLHVDFNRFRSTSEIANCRQYAYAQNATFLMTLHRFRSHISVIQIGKWGRVLSSDAIWYVTSAACFGLVIFPPIRWQIKNRTDAVLGIFPIVRRVVWSRVRGNSPIGILKCRFRIFSICIGGFRFLRIAVVDTHRLFDSRWESESSQRQMTISVMYIYSELCVWSWWRRSPRSIFRRHSSADVDSKAESILIISDHCSRS